jgi:hypothetical protein
MKSSLIGSFLTVLLLATVIPSLAEAQSDFPRLTVVSPDTGKIGDELTVQGENLDKKLVRELYLTDGQNDYKTDILDQAATAIKFKIPGNAKPGRFSLMILTAGADPKLIEQPVKVTVQ